jgi:hypothetical protein
MIYQAGETPGLCVRGRKGTGKIRRRAGSGIQIEFYGKRQGELMH